MPDSFPLSASLFKKLRGFGDTISFAQARSVYAPLAAFLAKSVHASPNRPFFIGITGSVAVGKSTTARLLTFLLSQPPYRLNTTLVPTDGFLFPTAKLQSLGLMEKKGFPESFDTQAFFTFLNQVKACESTRAPTYSHILYDIVPGAYITVHCPDVVILEGLNILPAAAPYLDFSIYVDALASDIEAWFIQRFLDLRDTMKDPGAYFHRFAYLTDEQARTCAATFWHTINLPNLEQNIAPFKPLADLVLNKRSDHSVASMTGIVQT